jgi:RNA polymerase sigma factor for flagellar operon FliA
MGTMALKERAEPRTGATSGGTAQPAQPPKRRGLRRGPDMSAVWEEFKQTGDEGLRNRLVEHYHYLVKLISNRIACRLPRSIDVQDLRSAGVFGLMRAIENFDLARGTPFESYCATRVRGAILDELRAQDWVPRLVRNRASTFNTALIELRQRLGREPAAHETARFMGVTVDDAERLRRDSNLTHVYNLTPLEDGEDESRTLRRLDVLMDRESDLPFERMVAQDLAKALVNVLVGPERTVIALYYYEGLTMKEIGRVMGISESRVCQIHTKTLKKLKVHIDNLGEKARLSLLR